MLTYVESRWDPPDGWKEKFKAEWGDLCAWLPNQAEREKGMEGGQNLSRFHHNQKRKHRNGYASLMKDECASTCAWLDALLELIVSMDGKAWLDSCYPCFCLHIHSHFHLLFWGASPNLVVCLSWHVIFLIYLQGWRNNPLSYSSGKVWCSLNFNKVYLWPGSHGNCPLSIRDWTRK